LRRPNIFLHQQSKIINHKSFPMNRPRYVWLAFTLCAAMLIAAMGWLTAHAVRVDGERSAARAEAELEQRISLALWRMDTKLAPLIAEEVARPHAFYEPFLVLSSPDEKSPAEPVPSPLLTSLPENVLLHFKCPSGGDWTSPQVPPPAQASLAIEIGCSPSELKAHGSRLDELSRKVDADALIAQLPSQPLPQWATSARWPQQSWDAQEDNPFGKLNDQIAQQDNEQPFLQNYGANAPPRDEQQRAPQQQQQAAAFSGKSAKAAADLDERSGRLQEAAQQEFNKNRASNSLLFPAANAELSKPVIESVSRPLWVGDQLLLARRVQRDGQTFVQGSWLDWPRIRGQLLAETADLLPNADLHPVNAENDAEPTRMLAALPVELIVGKTAAALPVASTVDAPLQWALTFGWTALLLALAAVAALLWGVLALSERRAAFVSSVTHELRTPLTTFRMYAEMLARDMVPSPERRREYLETLKTEAERLTHLVENVLSYARLERGRRPQCAERTTPVALVERLQPRLAERAARADMQLECTVDDNAKSAWLMTDVGVVEQILFNLVDNAAKYAARAEDRRILLHVARDRDRISFRVTDHGPGFANLRSAERSAPFSKSAQEAAETAPGVGLGLALCRRLAKELGGRLEIAPQAPAEVGARITLHLPQRQ
jgi:signal transduction histidine kinase